MDLVWKRFLIWEFSLLAALSLTGVLIYLIGWLSSPLEFIFLVALICILNVPFYCAHAGFWG